MSDKRGNVVSRARGSLLCSGLLFSCIWSSVTTYVVLCTDSASDLTGGGMVLLVAVVLLGCLGVIIATGEQCSVGQLKAEIQDISVTQYRVRFKITNQGDTGMCVLKWNTMMDDTFWAASVGIFDGEKLMEYAKPVIPIRQEIKDLDYAFIGVDEVQSVTVTRDLSDFFSFTSKKKYFLQIETKPEDCYTATKATNCKARIASAQRPLNYTSPEKASVDVQFTASISKTAVTETFDDWLKRNSAERQNVDNSIVAFGTPESVTEERFNDLISAHAYASLYLELASGYLKPLKLSHLPLYVDWFGKYSKSNYKTVRDNFIETYEDTKEPHVYNFLPDSLCKEKWLGAVDAVLLGKRQHIINICPSNFFEGSVSSTERAITIAHEMTHDSAATQDQEIKGKDCYGTDNCKALANTTPDLAIWSAESYALFAFEVYSKSKANSGSAKRKATRVLNPAVSKRTKKGPAVTSIQGKYFISALLHLLSNI